MKYRILKNKTIYQVFVRNYSQEGTFSALQKDLPRLVELGIDILYLLPIHPIGVLARKGTLGSPYSITDYYGINPELGTKKDFDELVKQAHALGLQVMMDIVFNHTARDAVWVKEHPEFYIYKQGQLANRVGDWSDIADLDFSNPKVSESLIDILVYWTNQGIDGFRCDVAPLIPLSFWKQARERIDVMNPNLIWLSESVDPGFIQWLREQGHQAHSDAEMYQAFDVLYDYDIFHALEGYFHKKNDLKKYLTLVNTQSYIYPSTYLKMHHLENHDTTRAASYIKSINVLKNMTAWSFFQPGLGFVYAGQETLQTKTPSLFDKDSVNVTIHDQSFYAFMQTLIRVKKHPEFQTIQRMELLPVVQPDLIVARLSTSTSNFYGIFNLTKQAREIYVPVPDGEYENLYHSQPCLIQKGILSTEGPVLIRLPIKS